MLIADAHADSLMWNRDLTVASEEGQADFPRLREAGVGLQCFTVVTRGFPFIGGFPLFARYRRWPRDAIRGEWARAQFQLDQMERYCARSADTVRITRTRAELEDNLSAGRLSAILGIEGAHALENDPARVQQLWERGVRFMGLTHLSNNSLGGSSFPLMGNRPLTSHGREVLDEMTRLGMSVDVAHASRRSLQEILDHPTARPFSSHTGCSGAGGGWRNLDDAALRTLANKGGVVGIIFATVYLGGSKLEDIGRHVDHAVNVMGEDAVGLGSDFDGMVPLPHGMKDARDLVKLPAILRGRGYSEARVEKIMGGNFRRFFSETLG